MIPENEYRAQEDAAAALYATLQENAQCMLMRLDVNGKKTPISAITGTPMRINSRVRYTSLDKCVKVYLEACNTDASYDGIMFAIPDNWLVLDADHCISIYTGVLDAWAEPILQFPSYREVSPGGEGLHVIAHADIPLNGKSERYPIAGAIDRRAKVELLGPGTLCTVTFDPYRNSPDDFPNLAHEVAVYRDSLILQKQHIKRQSRPKQQIRQLTGNAMVDELYHSDWSEADFWTCCEYARRYYCNPILIDDSYRKSDLYQHQAYKWDIKHHSDGRTYGQMTIDAAIAYIHRKQLDYLHPVMVQQRIWQNPTLYETQKRLLAELYHVWRRDYKDASGRVAIHYRRLEDNTGIGYRTIQRQMKMFAQADIVNYDVQTQVTDDGIFKHVRIGFGDAFNDGIFDLQ